VTADLRGFDYALEPVRRQRQWELDAARARLGRVIRSLEEAQRSLRDLVARHRGESERTAHALAERMDPARHRNCVQWLAELRADILRAEETLRSLQEECARARAECVARQQKLEVIEQHRHECVAEFTQEREARSSTEADREWLARTSVSPPKVAALEGENS